MNFIMIHLKPYKCRHIKGHVMNRPSCSFKGVTSLLRIVIGYEEHSHA